MTVLAWFLNEAAVPASIAVLVIAEIRRDWWRLVFRFRCWSTMRQIRAYQASEPYARRLRSGRPVDPQGRSAAAGVERGNHPACAPPATPKALVGAVDPRSAAPTRLHPGGGSP